MAMCFANFRCWFWTGKTINPLTKQLSVGPTMVLHFESPLWKFHCIMWTETKLCILQIGHITCYVFCYIWLQPLRLWLSGWTDLLSKVNNMLILKITDILPHFWTYVLIPLCLWKKKEHAKHIISSAKKKKGNISHPETQTSEVAGWIISWILIPKSSLYSCLLYISLSVSEDYRIVNTHTQTHIHVCMHTHTCTRTHRHTCMPTRMHTHKYAHSE